MARIIITGGTGFIGRSLVEYLKGSNYDLIILSRNQSAVQIKSTQNKNEENSIQYSYWNPDQKIIDLSIFSGDYYLINLTGENIGGRRWTAKQKQKIIASRTVPADFLAETCAMATDKPQACISTSAIGFYGAITSENIFRETDRPHTDFLGSTCDVWEKSTQKLSAFTARNIILRLGIVLSSKGGALPQIALPIKLFLGNHIGNGQQYINWIHIDDLCRWMVYCIENKTVDGIYNTCTTESVSNAELTKNICEQLKRPYISIGIPEFILKIILGEMSDIITKGCRADAGKISTTGFSFHFPTIASALKNIYNG